MKLIVALLLLGVVGATANSCPGGTIPDGDDCTTCEAGTYASGEDTECTDADGTAGEVVPYAGMDGPWHCPTGTQANAATKATSCDDCGVGAFSDTGYFESCTDCTANDDGLDTYPTKEGDDCQPCAGQGMIVVNGMCVCDIENGYQGYDYGPYPMDDDDVALTFVGDDQRSRGEGGICFCMGYKNYARVLNDDGSWSCERCQAVGCRECSDVGTSWMPTDDVEYKEYTDAKDLNRDLTKCDSGRCRDGYYFDANIKECVEITIDNCAEHGDQESYSGAEDATCEYCVNGYYWDSDAEACTACATDCVSCDSDGCHQCAEGKGWDENDMCTVTCPTGCAECHSEVVEDGETTTTVVECDGCMDGYRSDEGDCVACAEHCRSCNAQECHECDRGYHSTNDSEECTLCADTHDWARDCEESQAYTCMEGYGMHWDSGTCVQCEAGCSNCYVYDLELAGETVFKTECRKCADGHFTTFKQNLHNNNRRLSETSTPEERSLLDYENTAFECTPCAAGTAYKFDYDNFPWADAIGVYDDDVLQSGSNWENRDDDDFSLSSYVMAFFQCPACAEGTFAAGEGSTECTAWTACGDGETGVDGSATSDQNCVEGNGDDDGEDGEATAASTTTASLLAVAVAGAVALLQ